MRWGAIVGVGVAAVLCAPAPSARGQVPDPSDATTALLRQICDLQWIEGACEATGYPDPQYRSGEDPSPGAPLAQRIGVLHEHSGYSDGDPDARPEDYYRAGREGHNVTDDGQGDTGVIIDFLLSSEHSENEKLPITTAAECIDPAGIPDGLAALDLEGILPPLHCSNIENDDAYRKWSETLAQAIEATEFTGGEYVGFTGMRGFEWTNDYYNHLGVYFSRNVVNAKIDGSYLSMDVMWDWLREPSTEGGGDDALVVFNHPGGLPALTPFDGSYPHNELLQELLGGANWNDVAYVPDVDPRVAGIEVNGGDDLSWYVRALTNGWHLGPVAAEDEHQREWSTSADGKTLMLTRGRSPRDYYFALEHHRTVAIREDLVNGAPGQPAIHPTLHWYADGTSVQDPAATLLGGTLADPGPHVLTFVATGLPADTPVVVVTNTSEQPIDLGLAGADGSLTSSLEVASPAPGAGEAWWFAVACPPSTDDCGTGETYSAVTAPIWAQAVEAPAPVAPAIRGDSESRLPATGRDIPLGGAAAAMAGLFVLRALRSRAARSS